jgi:hypothetical protein
MYCRIYSNTEDGSFYHCRSVTSFVLITADYEKLLKRSRHYEHSFQWDLLVRSSILELSLSECRETLCGLIKMGNDLKSIIVREAVPPI